MTIYENIKNCTSGKITLNNGKKYDIKKIVGVDKENNLAIIQIGIKKSTPVKFGDSNDIEMGDKVYSITYTTEDSLEDANSVLAEGMIYKVESNSKGTTSIQTTATTSKANKGGVLFNEYGKVIGVISSKLNVSGVGFDMVNVCEPIKLIDKVKRNINLSMDNYVNNLLKEISNNIKNIDRSIKSKKLNK